VRWTDLPLLAFDTETTGLAPENGDRVIEFAAVELRVSPELAIVSCKRHEYLFDPGVPLSAETVHITKIKDEDLAGKPPFEQRAKEIHALFDRPGIVVGQNLPFDYRFLCAEFARAGLSWPNRMVEVDTYDIARKHLSGSQSQTKLPDMKLGTLAAHLNVQLVEAHRAGNDAEACGRVLVALAQRLHAPAELDAFVGWCGGLDPLPDNDFLARRPDGVVVFREGEHAEQPVEAHPDVLQWLLLARARGADGTWSLRVPPALRAWVERFLKVRCSGRFPVGLKQPGAADWGIDTPSGAESSAHAGAGAAARRPGARPGELGPLALGGGTS
jgi:DNA polymerase III epsilon subunit-like protein